jgi:protein arginine kinase activator
MQCDECKENEAVINFTQIVNNEMTTYHLCEKCAEKKGLGEEEKIKDSPLSSFMSKMSSETPDSVDVSKGDDPECDTCKSKLSDFKKNGRLGCPDCYYAFEDELSSLLRKIHGSHIHVGRTQKSSSLESSPVEVKIRDLKKRLEESVNREEYEMAARLRDEIKVLEKAVVKSEETSC